MLQSILGIKKTGIWRHAEFLKGSNSGWRRLAEFLNSISNAVGAALPSFLTVPSLFAGPDHGGEEKTSHTVDGERRPENFIIAYDDGEGPHCLTVGKYGKGPLREGERWVLLEPVEEVVPEA